MGKVAPGSTSRKKTRSAETQAKALQRTRKEHAMETAEDYVEAIFDLKEIHGEARTVDLAKRLGVSHVTVSRTLGRLQRDGYISTEPYRSVFLTEKGRELALESRKRHEIVVAFLHALGIPDPIAQADAEGIEHHCSPETLIAFERYISAKK